MCKSVTLYGHLTVDRILVGFKETPSLGGIANVWSGLVSQGQGLNVSIQPLSIGHALVIDCIYLGLEETIKRYCKITEANKNK